MATVGSPGGRDKVRTEDARSSRYAIRQNQFVDDEHRIGAHRVYWSPPSATGWPSPAATSGPSADGTSRGSRRFEDGAIDETLQVESPLEPNPNASLAEEQSEEVNVQEVLDNVVELSDQATQQVMQVNSADAVNSGTPGSSVGNGGRRSGLGMEPEDYRASSDGL